MSTLFFFGENLSLYLSWLRTNAGPVPDAPARGEPGQVVAGVDTSCFASAPFPVAGVDVLSLRETTTSCCRSSCTYKHATGMFALRRSPGFEPLF